MDKIAVTGGTPLKGTIPISGSKNACLPLMTAALLTDQPFTLTNVPNLADMATMAALLRSLGAEVDHDADAHRMEMRVRRLSSPLAHYDIVRKMRASILVLGPMLARDGAGTVSLPGGCAIGARPVDLHLKGLEAMGATLDLRDGYVHATVPRSVNGGRLRGVSYRFPFVSVGATENLLMAATLAKGTTRLVNAAREPEITDLADCLSGMGARIEGAGTSTIEIEGVEALSGTEHAVIADRIELGSFMIAPAITGGDVTLQGGALSLVSTLAEALDAAGISVEDTPDGLRVRRRNGTLNPVSLTTEPFPGYATDLQAQMMALMTLADGTSTITEQIFENRFMHVPELSRMGAQIEINGNTATVTGVESLRGAPVMATDLRASISLLLAGLAAEGETVVSRVYHLDRGYERVEEKLRACGAQIERIRGNDNE
jgi:UDP-N-acetylglucosamine 1-carboxyvinyltransferase